MFSRTEDLSTQHAASKLSNGVALTISDLGKEPAKGLLRVVDHVQGSVPGLLQTNADVRAGHAQVKAVLEEAVDARDGVGAAVGAVSEAARRSLRGSLARLAGAPGPAERRSSSEGDGG